MNSFHLENQKIRLPPDFYNQKCFLFWPLANEQDLFLKKPSNFMCNPFVSLEVVLPPPWYSLEESAFFVVPWSLLK